MNERCAVIKKDWSDRDALPLLDIKRILKIKPAPPPITTPRHVVFHNLGTLENIINITNVLFDTYTPMLDVDFHVFDASDIAFWNFALTERWYVKIKIGRSMSIMCRIIFTEHNTADPLKFKIRLFPL